jgi:protein-S-isoprenylcysteine O-methyltransferase Ste14
MTEPYGPYGPYPQTPAPYGQPYPLAPREHPQGTLILVLGILGFVVAGICAPFAWYLGSKALREIRTSGLVYSNVQHIIVGRVLGMVMTILAIVALVFFLVFAVVLVLTATVNR